MQPTFSRCAIQFLNLVFACIVCASCATTPRDEAVLGDTVLKENEGIIVFSIITNSYNSDDEKLAGEAVPNRNYVLNYSPATNLTVRQIVPIFGTFGSSSGSMGGNMREPEKFVVRRLPAGEYSIFKFHISLGSISGSSNIDLRFTITPNKVTYLGKVQIDWYAKRVVFGRPLSIKVSDDLNNATKIFKERNPGLGYEITTNLIRIEQ